MPAPEQRTMVYVDGFNLYYGVLKDSPYRWLDVRALCEKFLRRHQRIVGIKYFAARVKERPDNPGQQVRQQAYLRALELTADLEVHYGTFLTHEADRCLARPPSSGSPIRTIIETKEKGSDVNLASHLLIDRFRARFDLAVVVSNDSDLAMPINFVREEFPVGILNPHRKRSFDLSPQKLPHGCFYKKIKRGHLADCQLPERLEDQHGTISKPPSWAEDQLALKVQRKKNDPPRRRRERPSKSGKSRPKAAPHPRGRNQRGR